MQITGGHGSFADSGADGGDGGGVFVYGGITSVRGSSVRVSSRKHRVTGGFAPHAHALLVVDTGHGIASSSGHFYRRRSRHVDHAHKVGIFASRLALPLRVTRVPFSVESETQRLSSGSVCVGWPDAIARPSGRRR